MIVLGTDTHKASHTAAALDEGTGRVLAERTVSAKRRSFEDLLLWGRRLDGERFAIRAPSHCRNQRSASGARRFVASGPSGRLRSEPC